MGSLPKALAYAEDQLGVHRVWNGCQEVTLRLQDLYRERAGYESESRHLAYQIDSRKADILREVNLNNPELSQAALDRAYRLACAEDDDLGSLQELQLQSMAHRDRVNADINGAETNHKGFVARMRELDGYLNYLASVKMAETAAKYQTTAPEWPY